MITEECIDYYNKELSFRKLIIDKARTDFYLSMSIYAIGILPLIYIIYKYKMSWQFILYLIFLLGTSLWSLIIFTKKILRKHYNGIKFIELRHNELKSHLQERNLFNKKALKILSEHITSKKTILNFPPLAISTIFVAISIPLLTHVSTFLPPKAAILIGFGFAFVTFIVAYLLMESYVNKLYKDMSFLVRINSYRLELEQEINSELDEQTIRIRDILPSRFGYYVTKIMDYTLGN